ncbi:unnamed protein product [Rhodiola kirilowii]
MAFPRAKVLNPHHCDDQFQDEAAGEPPKKINRRSEVNTTTPMDVDASTPIKYLPLQRVYSASTQSADGKTGRVWNTKTFAGRDRGELEVKVYHRRNGAKRMCYLDMLAARQEMELEKGMMAVNEGEAVRGFIKGKKCREGVKMRETLNSNGDLSNGIHLRQCRTSGVSVGIPLQKKRKRLNVSEKVFSGQTTVKRWVGLSFEDADPKAFFGLACKVYWPLDDVWYSGNVMAYNPGTCRHQVKYEDGDAEDLMLSKERIKFLISLEDLQQLNLKMSWKNVENGTLDYDELLVLAASLDDCQEVEPGDIIWAKLTGYAMWPAIVVDESCVGSHKGLTRSTGDGMIPVQFFGSHDFARIKPKQLTSFLRGLMLSCHLKCKKPQFLRSLEEAKMYLNEQKLPDEMLKQQNSWRVDLENGKEEASISDEGDLRTSGTEDGITLPIEIGDLRVVSLGRLVKESGYYKDGKYICPEGYKAVRKYTSICDPKEYAFYHMEVHRDSQAKQQPLFVVTSVTGETFKGATPSACWNKIYKRIRKLQHNTSADNGTEGGTELCTPGCEMFGFSDPTIFKLIQKLASQKASSKFSKHKLTYKNSRDLPPGYSLVNVAWNDFDKCNVCHMDEEYENNLFLQCDKCRMLVHARCYGEVEPVGEKLWLCKLCRPGAPVSPPLCCLCPHKGGAMKPTTDGRWAHLACAMWIPETCLSDVKTMEPIDGLSRINKDRWKLLCSICGVSYGACIQCSNPSCRVAYHPLCARAAGYCVELENEESLHLISIDENEEDQCIRLLSFCKKHKQPTYSRPSADDNNDKFGRQCSEYDPPRNPSGCARTEPYSFFGRRGRKEPEALATASPKCLFVENQPHLVSGHTQHEYVRNTSKMNELVGSKFSFSLQQTTLQLESSENILSVAEKYSYMKDTFKKRLAFGKSRIHGFGIFTKYPHKAGDMVIEYTGELVRPSVADKRENVIYNSLVGAGTYMFRIDDQRVIDATRAGSIAHLINHSCEPNCYSRVISVSGQDHIIIFAKRDIKQWEELTYDYRFYSKDERLPCYCGHPRCRGVVNDIEAEGQVTKLYVPRSELTEWKGK